MDDERFRDQREVAKYAIFCGIDATSKKYNLSPALLTNWVHHLDFDDLPLFTELRRIARELALKKGFRVAAKELGVTESLMETFVKGSEEPVKFVEMKCQQTQTPEFAPTKRPRVDAEVQTSDLPPDPPSNPEPSVKKYTTAQKLKAVKSMQTYRTPEEAATAQQYPVDKLLRWRTKVKSSLFQDVHVERLYGVRQREVKDRFFFELDEALYKWWQAHQNETQNVDGLLVEKAKTIAKVDDAVPVISPAWVSSFRAFYKI